MAAEVHDEFPLFPLGLVALPSELVPLHIFEDRYKLMMSHCLDRSSEFGIVWMSDDGLRDIGCACEIDRVIERMEDGRINLVARGTRPIRILERQSHLPYPAGVVEFLEDTDEPSDPQAADPARQIYAELVRRATDREPDEAELAEFDAYGMAATVDFGLAGPARAAFCGGAPAARRPAVSRGDQAPGLRRPCAGTRPLQRQGPLRVATARRDGLASASWGVCPDGRSARQSAQSRDGDSFPSEVCELQRAWRPTEHSKSTKPAQGAPATSVKATMNAPNPRHQPANGRRLPRSK